MRLGALFDQRHGIINNALRQTALATVHDAPDELGHIHVAVLRVRQDQTVNNFSATRHDASFLLRLVSSGTSLSQGETCELHIPCAPEAACVGLLARQALPPT